MRKMLRVLGFAYVVGVAFLAAKKWEAGTDRTEIVAIQVQVESLNEERTSLELRQVSHDTPEWQAFSERSQQTWAEYRSIQKRHPEWQWKPQ